MRRAEKTWFEGAQEGEVIEFYLTTSYLKFIVANGVIVTTKYWKEGLPESIRGKGQQAKEALQSAFPGRRVVQIDAMPLHLRRHWPALPFENQRAVSLGGH